MVKTRHAELDRTRKLIAVLSARYGQPEVLRYGAKFPGGPAESDGELDRLVRTTIRECGLIPQKGFGTTRWGKPIDMGEKHRREYYVRDSNNEIDIMIAVDAEGKMLVEYT